MHSDSDMEVVCFTFSGLHHALVHKLIFIMCHCDHLGAWNTTSSQKRNQHSTKGMNLKLQVTGWNVNCRALFLRQVEPPSFTAYHAAGCIQCRIWASYMAKMIGLQNLSIAHDCLTLLNTFIIFISAFPCGFRLDSETMFWQWCCSVLATLSSLGWFPS